jgi:hypothetical protein
LRGSPYLTNLRGDAESLRSLLSRSAIPDGRGLPGFPWKLELGQQSGGEQHGHKVNDDQDELLQSARRSGIEIEHVPYPQGVVLELRPTISSFCCG